MLLCLEGKPIMIVKTMNCTFIPRSEKQSRFDLISFHEELCCFFILNFHAQLTHRGPVQAV